MNSMLQNNGMVLSFPSQWGVALRSSPILCLFDSIELTLSWLAFILFNAESPSTAAKRIARLRFRDVPDNASDQSFTSLRKIFWIIQVFFVLSTLLQAMKLFAMRGIGGTQVCAIFYLYSWLVSEALVWTAGSDWKTSPLLPIGPGPLSTIANQGLLSWMPFHIVGVLYHCLWLDGLLSDLVHLKNISMGNQLAESLILGLSVLILGAVLPFLIYNSNLPRLINLSAGQIKLLPYLSVLVLVVGELWNSLMECTIRHEPFKDCIYYGGPSIVVLLDMTLGAFAEQSRNRVFGIIPLMQYITGWALWIPLGEHTGVLDDTIFNITAIFLMIGNLPDNFLRWMDHKLQRVKRFKVPYIRRKHFLFITTAIYIALSMITPFFSFSAGLTTITTFTYLLLHILNQSFNTNRARFPPTVAGTSFVTMHAVLALLWYWKVWAEYKPECTVKPAWTSIPFG